MYRVLPKYKYRTVLLQITWLPVVFEVNFRATLQDIYFNGLSWVPWTQFASTSVTQQLQRMSHLKPAGNNWTLDSSAGGGAPAPPHFFQVERPSVGIYLHNFRAVHGVSQIWVAPKVFKLPPGPFLSGKRYCERGP